MVPTLYQKQESIKRNAEAFYEDDSGYVIITVVVVVVVILYWQNDKTYSDTH